MPKKKGVIDLGEISVGAYVFDHDCGEEGFVVSLHENGNLAVVQYLTSDGPEEDTALITDLEVCKRPESVYDISEACAVCGYLHHANNCTIQPGEYCKRYHIFERKERCKEDTF